MVISTLAVFSLPCFGGDLDGDGIDDAVDPETLIESLVTVTVPTTVVNLRIASGGVLTADAPLTVMEGATIEAGGSLTHSVRFLDGLSIEVTGTFEIQPGGFVNVDGKGLRGGGNGSLFDPAGETYDATDEIVAGAGGSTGASYGGYGATPAGLPTNSVYGVLEDPRHLGSGGGTGAGGGGNGGGLIQITATNLFLDGTLRANGAAMGAGAGSGGGIRLEVSALSGSGAIEARGGDDHPSAGGGGRVAIYYDSTTFPDTNIEVRGGGPTFIAGAGTIYLKDNAAASGDLVIDNAGLPTSGFSTRLRGVGPGISTSLEPWVLTDLAAAFLVPDPITGAIGLVGLQLNPDEVQPQTFTIIDNTVDTITIDPGDGDLTTVSTTGDAYIGVYFLDNLFIRNGARVSTPDNIIGNIDVDGTSVLEAGVGTPIPLQDWGGLLGTPGDSRGQRVTSQPVMCRN